MGLSFGLARPLLRPIVGVAVADMDEVPHAHSVQSISLRLEP
jgi:hypothetical protein